MRGSEPGSEGGERVVPRSIGERQKDGVIFSAFLLSFSRKNTYTYCTSPTRVLDADCTQLLAVFGFSELYVTTNVPNLINSDALRPGSWRRMASWMLRASSRDLVRSSGKIMLTFYVLFFSSCFFFFFDVIVKYLCEYNLCARS